MVDFLIISTRSPKRGVLEYYPKFVIKKSSDLMIRGGRFYAIWLEDEGRWSTVEQDAIDYIDRETRKVYEANKNNHPGLIVEAGYLWDAESGLIDKWHKYCEKQMRDNFKNLDETLIFSNTEVNKLDYASKSLDYPLEKGSIEAYDKIISTLYTPEERHKIEWAIGSIITGESKRNQKFMVLYGSAGTGKSTILNIVEQLFKGYYAVFDAKALGTASNSFALEVFNSNPLVAIQHDGDLSKIEDNTRLNSLISHEEMTVNEKHKSIYTNRFLCFLFMGSNKPVKITDAKSGIIRRLIDVSPSGNKINPSEYRRLTKQVKFELGAIAYHCKEVYLEDPGYYDDYIPTTMMGATNDFYNFVEESFMVFNKTGETTLRSAWEMYLNYCEESKVPYPLNRRAFKEELKNYFRDFEEHMLIDGEELSSYYGGFIADKFKVYTPKKKKEKKEEVESYLIEFNSTKDIFDDECSECFAQYASDSGTPFKKWEKVTTKLSDLDTSKLHYVKIPEQHIVIDFDIPDENGNKCLEKNIEAASKFPATYAELSKSGAGIHLHYIYTGDVTKLSREYGDHIEIKVFTGNSSLRRQFTKSNGLPINSISSGLPLREVKKMIDDKVIKSEKGLRVMIERNLRKEIHPGTKPSIDFIHDILEGAYNSGLKYDVSDMRKLVLTFAANSTHQAKYCVGLVSNMKFKSEDCSEPIDDNEKPIVFYDVEVFPNLFLVNWKYEGEGKQVVRMINPDPKDIEMLLKFRLIGFNCRRYDNHILYARLMGYTNEELYRLSQNIIDKDKKEMKGVLFSEAYNLSYTDVYDYAATKQSLKKWEIELGIHHQELGLPWDQPVPEELWTKVAEYCDNDVIATEAVHNHLKADFMARKILASLADGTVNDTTNSLTTKLIFGKTRNTSTELQWRNMGECNLDDYTPFGYDEYTLFNKKDQPIFPGYKYEFGVSTYRGEEVGEGGYVYSEPGMYGNVALLDIVSMHPHSAIAENLFGKYTKRFADIVHGRVVIKHEDWDVVSTILDGKLTPYVEMVKNGEITSKDLANALKIAINSVYGLTSAKFTNPFRDGRNVDNIVAKRGALFMINLKHEVQKRGFKVVHIKTDSIKIADATPEIIEFVKEYGKLYKYEFEHEATYDRMCLVNKAVYIAKYDNGEWTATGTQFQVPYVFKQLFSKEDIEFKDMCETKQVSKGFLYLDMNENLSDVTAEEKEYAKLLKKIKETEGTDQYIGPECRRLDELSGIIEKGHNYVFVGKVGSFCPVKPGGGGGTLYRGNEGKYYNATGAEGYRWLEAEVIEREGRFDDIDRSYYERLVDEAVDSISHYGDFEWFVSDDPYVGPPCDDQGRPIYLDCGTIATDLAAMGVQSDPLPYFD